jgi:glycosyltransferase involved in cell wall biosynthesis
MQNPKMLAEKIAVLLEDPALRLSMGQKGKERFLDHFTVRQFEKNINRTFQRILNGETTPAGKASVPVVK